MNTRPPAARPSVEILEVNRSQRSRMRSWAAITVGSLALAAAVAAVYGPAVDSPFIFDDATSVVNNPSIRRLWPLVDFSSDLSPLSPPRGLPTSARPVVNLSLALNYGFGRLNPMGYHVVNMVVHTFSALLLWAIVYRTLRSAYFRGRFDGVAGWLSFVAALLWAVHPLATETVNYVTQRTELVMACFYLLTLLAGLRYWAAESSASRTAWLLLATVACLLGMLSKEVMVSAPLVVLLFERTFLAGSFGRALRDSWPLYLGLALTWIPLLGIIWYGPHTPNAGFDLEVPAAAWWYTQAKVLFVYLKLVVWPWPLVIHYEMPYLDSFAAGWPWALAAALLVAATLLLVWRRTAVGFVGACVLAILAPTFLIPMANEVAAERRMYLPLAAIVPCLVVAGYALADRLARYLRLRVGRTSVGQIPIATTVVAALAVAGTFGLASAGRSAMYQDELLLWHDAALHQPDNYTVRYNHGTLLAIAGRNQQAIAQFEEALRLRPNSADAHFNLARALAESGLRPEAIGHYQQALRLNPEFAAAHNNLGLLLAGAGEAQAAIGHYEEAVRLVPDFAAAHSNLGIELAGAGRMQEAIEHFEQALELKRDVDAYVNLAAVYAQAGRGAEAIAMAEKALGMARALGDGPRAALLEAWLADYRRREPLP
jgi:protein O-mannosyl-transferase